MAAAHPNINAWKRDSADGAYLSEPPRWSLRVYWCPPDTAFNRGSFRWEASRKGEPLHHSESSFSELEHAMAAAEHYARDTEQQQAGALAQRIEQAIDSSG